MFIAISQKKTTSLQRSEILPSFGQLIALRWSAGIIFCEFSYKHLAALRPAQLVCGL
jgi:hypothetical protein